MSNNIVGGEELKIKIPVIPKGDLPQSIVKLCDYHDIQHLEGKLKTWADSSFVDEIQRKAVKDILQNIARDFWVWLDFSCDGTTYKQVGYFQRLKQKQNNQ